MFIGPKPFTVDSTSGELRMGLRPALPSWAFDDEGEATFKMFGYTNVTLVSPGGVALKGGLPRRYEVEYKWHDGKDVVEESTIPEYIANQVRNLDVKSIKAWF